jgi:hypothetical protein
VPGQNSVRVGGGGRGGGKSEIFMGSGGSAGNLHNIQYMRHNGDQKKSHVELLNEAIATPLKKCEWIGEQGGGEKSVKFWSEMMPQRPVGQKNVSN